MIDITGYWIICTMIAHMFIETVLEGTSQAALLAPVSANIPSVIWHLLFAGQIGWRLQTFRLLIGEIN